MANKKAKKYVEAAKLVETGKLYEVKDALELVAKTKTANFVETIEVAPPAPTAVAAAAAGRQGHRHEARRCLRLSWHWWSRCPPSRRKTWSGRG